METKCLVSIIPSLFFNVIYQVGIYEGSCCSLKQFLNYDEALKYYNERKAQGFFDTLELVVTGTIEEAVNDGNVVE